MAAATATSDIQGRKEDMKSTVADTLELPEGAVKQSMDDITEDGMDHTPTEEMNNLVHFNALEPSHCGTIREVSASNKLLQRKYAPKDFHFSKSAEIHRLRRRQIIKAHPEILDIQGPDYMNAVFGTATVFTQLILAYYVRNWSWPWFLLVTYVVGGTLQHSVVMGLHEISHDMFFKTRIYNRIFAVFLNLPTGVAIASTFRRYHLDHHSSQGVPGIDVDVPTRAEANLFKTTYGKLTWAFFQPFFYSLRPMIVHPLPMSLWEAFNWIVQLTFDYLVIKFLGMGAFLYLLLGLFMGMSLHPMSAHFVAEHYEFVYGQETYSYYGPLNVVLYNVGYHNEHHDFPAVAGRNLPKVRAIAPEWYDLPCYRSWSYVLYDFITSDRMNLYCRVQREHA